MTKRIKVHNQAEPAENMPIKMKVGDHARQGDTLLRKIEALPVGAEKLARDKHGRHVLAHGERTGHAHAFRETGVCAFSKLEDSEIEYLIVAGGSGATLRHELVSGQKAEHDAIIYPDGVFEAAGQYEHAPEPLRVED